MNPEDQISVTLTAQQWNTVMQMLGEQPYRVSAQLIQAIQMQCMNHEVRQVQERHSVSGQDSES